MSRIGPLEILVLIAILAVVGLVIFFVFKAGQWRGEARSKKNENKN